MEIDEVKNIEAIKRLKDMCLRTLKPAGNKSGLYTAEIRVFDFLELASIIRNLIKLSGLYWELPCSYFQLMNLNC